MWSMAHAITFNNFSQWSEDKTGYHIEFFDTIGDEDEDDEDAENRSISDQIGLLKSRDYLLKGITTKLLVGYKVLN